MMQQTLGGEFTVKGKGLHTGLEIEATFYPAPENHGYKFQRIDLPGEPVIDALAENVIETGRGTVIAKGDVRVSTIEHALAALYAAGVDNCLIKLNAPEVPILDGSAKIFVEEIERVGLVDQSIDKNYYVVKHKIEVRDPESGAHLTVLPDSDFSVDVMISYDSPVLTNQYARLENVADFNRNIASSRTFVFVREVEALLNANLIKGGDLDNAIVIYDRKLPQEQLDHIADLIGVAHKEVSDFGYINNRPLVFENEPARHKLLDVVGDVALIGRPLKGRIIACRPGHKINTTFAKQIRKEIQRQELQAPSYNPSAAPLMDINCIREHLPHRYPMLLVDKIIDKSETYIVGVKNVTVNEPFFQGHFPGAPIMPGVLILEALAQTGALLAVSGMEGDLSDKLFFFTGLDGVKFRRQVVPGDRLELHCDNIRMKLKLCKMDARAYVDGKLAAEAQITAAIGDRPKA